MGSFRCPRCGRENEVSFAFCLDCGQSLRSLSTPTEIVCPGCGKAIQPGFRFCGHCGAAVRAPIQSPQGRPAAQVSAKLPGPTPPPTPRPPKAGPVRLSAVRHDGLPGAVYPIERPDTICGRLEGEIRIAEDPTISPRHAKFTFCDGDLTVEDLGSVNGTYVRLREPAPLAVGEEFRVGRQLLRVEPLVRPQPPTDGVARPWGTPDPGFRFRLSQLLEGGGLGEVFPLRNGENTIGRETGDVAFPNDRYVSARHARIDVSEAGITLRDVGSSNGTFVKISGVTELRTGDQLLLGGQLLRVDG